MQKHSNRTPKDNGCGIYDYSVPDILVVAKKEETLQTSSFGGFFEIQPTLVIS